MLCAQIINFLRRLCFATMSLTDFKSEMSGNGCRGVASFKIVLPVNNHIFP